MTPDLDVPGVPGHHRKHSDLTRLGGLALREAGRRYGAGRTAPGFTGLARVVVDHMESWVAAGACDGFMVQVPYLPGGLEDFARLAVPELQQCRLFRTGYTGATLRDIRAWHARNAECRAEKRSAFHRLRRISGRGWGARRWRKALCFSAQLSWSVARGGSSPATRKNLEFRPTGLCGARRYAKDRCIKH
jgi:hypothetical protein